MLAIKNQLPEFIYEIIQLKGPKKIHEPALKK